ncbi:hypothetical protein ACGF5F_32405 [Streptomyces sp. NPDC047821]|uniref:hypothetical protein n=1 Tax=Streptomyces sp. NPDC047821 TaxID=3365488 RepID=UPI003723535C
MAERLTPEYEAEIREHVATMSNYTLGNLFARDLLAEVDRLRQQRKYLIDQLAKRDARSGDGNRALRDFLDPDAAASGSTAGDERTPCSFPPCDAEAGEPCDEHEREQAHAEGEHAFCGPECTAGDEQPETSPWQQAVDGLNTLVDAGIPLHIEPDGHIANPCGDEHIEWNRETSRWQLVMDEEGTR